jgi:hypothetical protein
MFGFAAKAPACRGTSAVLAFGAAAAILLGGAAHASVTLTSLDAAVPVEAGYHGDDYYFAGELIVSPTDDSVNPWVWITPFNATLDAGAGPESALAFCIDPFTQAPSFGSPGDPTSYTYEPMDWANPNAAQVGKLVNFGTYLYHNYTGDDFNLKLAAVQGAIWQVETGLELRTNEYWDTADHSDPLYSLIQQYADVDNSEVSAFSSQISTIVDDGVQSLAYSGVTVPEPETWALMMFGLFSVGGGLRAARRREAVAQA